MQSKLAFLLLATVGLIAVGLTACGDDDGDATTAPAAETTEPSGNAPAPSGDAVRSAKVEISTSAYDPDPVRIEAGGKVTWINRDSAAHTATAEDGSFDTGPIEEDKLKSETFKQPGAYEYFSSGDPDLRGTIVVIEPR